MLPFGSFVTLQGVVMNVFSRIVKYAREYYAPFYGYMSVVFLFLLGTEILGLLSPYLFGRMVDGIVSHKPIGSVMMIVLALLLFSLIGSAIGCFREVIEIKKLDFDVARHISRSSLEKILRFSLGQHLNENSGLKQSILSRGETAITNMVNNLIYMFIPLVIQVFVTTTALLWLSPIMGAVLFIGIVLYVAVSYFLNRGFYKKLTAFQEASRHDQRRYSEIVRNIALIKVSGKEQDTLDEFTTRRGDVYETGKKIWTRYILLAQGRSLVADLAKFLVIAIGVYLVYKGVHTPGELIAVLGWSSAAFSQLGRVGPLQRRFIDDLGNIDKYTEVISMEPAVKEPEQPIMLPYVRGDIRFHNVSFAYPRVKENEEKDGEEVQRNTLTDVSFTIHSGETVALVGHSGAGKTTIVNLLLRGYDPDRGQITLDGFDLRLIRGSEYRRHIGYVEQNVELFDETLEYNLLYGIPEAKKEAAKARLLEIAEQACIDRFYGRLGDARFQTLIGEKGIRLSGGERQRVGIARALIKDPAVLIFDEATSNLDADSESVIRDAMKQALHGRTGIIIAHRLSTIRDVDKIIMIDHGRIADVGTHEELMGRCVNYYSLVKKQLA